MFLLTAYKRNGDLVLAKRSPSDIPATEVTGCVKLPLLWLIYSGWVSPTLSSRVPSFRNLAVSSFRSPLSEINPGCCVLLRNLRPPGRISECCLPCGFLLSLFHFQNGPFISYLMDQIYYSLNRKSNFLSSVLLTTYKPGLLTNC